MDHKNCEVLIWNNSNKAHFDVWKYDEVIGINLKMVNVSNLPELEGVWVLWSNNKCKQQNWVTSTYESEQ